MVNKKPKKAEVSLDDSRALNVVAEGAWWRFYFEAGEPDPFIEVKQVKGGPAERAFTFEVEGGTDGVNFFRVGIPEAVLDAMMAEWMKRKEAFAGLNQPAKIKYKTRHGTVSWCNIEPISIWFGTVNGFHGERWFVRAYDTDTSTNRNFPLSNIKEWK